MNLNALDDCRVRGAGLGVFAAFLAATAWAAPARASAELQVSEAWVRETLPGQQVSAAYMQVKTPSAAALIGATSPVAKSVELHSMSVQNGVMRMRHLDRLPLAANETVKLQPGGHHLMLMGIESPLKRGDKVPLELMLEADGRETRVKLEVEVRASGEAPVHSR